MTSHPLLDPKRRKFVQSTTVKRSLTNGQLGYVLPGLKDPRPYPRLPHYTAVTNNNRHLGYALPTCDDELYFYLLADADWRFYLVSVIGLSEISRWPGQSEQAIAKVASKLGPSIQD
jgi:hypothetical protein